MSCENAKQLFDTLKIEAENYEVLFNELEAKKIEYITFRNHFKTAGECGDVAL